MLSIYLTNNILLMMVTKNPQNRILRELMTDLMKYRLAKILVMWFSMKYRIKSG